MVPIRHGKECLQKSRSGTAFHTGQGYSNSTSGYFSGFLDSPIPGAI